MTIRKRMFNQITLDFLAQDCQEKKKINLIKFSFLDMPVG